MGWKDSQVVLLPKDRHLEVDHRMSPEKQALKLLQKLNGDAFEKLEHIDPESLRRTDGIEVLKKAIVDVYEPIEDYRVGKVMDDFLYGFERRKGQEILDYNLSWQKELAKAEKVSGELTEKWKAHLYLTKMKLSDCLLYTSPSPRDS